MNSLDGGVPCMHSAFSVHAEKYRMAGAGWRLPGDETSIEKVAGLVFKAPDKTFEEFTPWAQENEIVTNPSDNRQWYV